MRIKSYIKQKCFTKKIGKESDQYLLLWWWFVADLSVFRDFFFSRWFLTVCYYSTSFLKHDSYIMKFTVRQNLSLSFSDFYFSQCELHRREVYRDVQYKKYTVNGKVRIGRQPLMLHVSNWRTRQ